MCVISGITVGFGDYSPQSQGERLAAVFFLPVAVAIFGQFLGRVASSYMDRQNRRREEEYLSRTLTLCDLNRMDTDHDGRVDRGEFLSFMLVAIHRVSQEDIDKNMRLFDKLDREKTGYLTKQDLVTFRLDDKVRRTVRRLSVRSD